MGSIPSSSPTPLKQGDAPSKALQRYRLKYGGRAQLHYLLDLVIQNVQTTLSGIVFTLKHRPPRDLEAIEKSLLIQLGNVENALAHVRRMRLHHDMPVSHGEWTSQHPELVGILRAGGDR